MTCRQCGGELLPGLGLCLKCATPTDARAGSGELEVSLGPVGAPARNSALTLLGAVVGPLDIADHERALLIAGPDDASLDLLGRWLTTRGAAVRLRPPGESPRWHVGFEPTPLAPGLVLVPVLTAAVVTFAAAATTVAWAGVAVTALLLLHVFGPRPASRRLAVGTIPGLETIDAPLAEHLRLVRASLTDPEAI
ncbi:MAG: hypothetical protein JNM17_27405, partial [Archangium sp.]|nr:hypothetical protein [Archangium sp.]